MPQTSSPLLPAGEYKNVSGFIYLQSMMKIRAPESPSEAFRRARAEHIAYNTGVVLRIIWEVVKPILGWALFIGLVGIWFTVSVIFQVLLGKK